MKILNPIRTSSYSIYPIAESLDNGQARHIAKVLLDILPSCRSLDLYTIENILGDYPNKDEMTIAYLIKRYRLKLYSNFDKKQIEVYAPIMELVPASWSIDRQTRYSARLKESKKLVILIKVDQPSSTLVSNVALKSKDIEAFVLDEKYTRPII